MVARSFHDGLSFLLAIALHRLSAVAKGLSSSDIAWEAQLPLPHACPVCTLQASKKTVPKAVMYITGPCLHRLPSVLGLSARTLRSLRDNVPRQCVENVCSSVRHLPDKALLFSPTLQDSHP